MVQVLLIGIGGFVGSIARHLLSGAVQSATAATFPYGTLAVNVLGCLVIGALSELADARAFLSSDARALLIIGCLGGFTTFSAFGNETMNLVRDSDWIRAAANVAAHVVLAIGAVWLGRAAAHLVWR
jgi:CrcB protein